MPIIGTRGSISSGGFGEFRRSGGGFSPYYILRASFGQEIIYSANSLSTAFTLKGFPPATGYNRLRRMGVLVARGNSVFASGGTSTNGGVTYTNTGVFVDQPDSHASGLDGSCTYNPTTNTVGYAYTFYPDAKSSTLQCGLITYNATTTSIVNQSASSISFSSGNGVKQVVYAPALSRYYIFTRTGVGTVQAYSAFNSSTGFFVQGSSVSADDVYSFAVTPSGFLRSISGNTLYDYTSQDLVTRTSLGTVSGIVGGTYRHGFRYLPVNQKYALLSQSGQTLYFSYSNAATPNQFTTVSINPGLGSMLSMPTANIFEDTDGKIYANYFPQYNTGKSTDFGSFSYVSTDGGASFSFYGNYLSFTKNLL
jgi:hypothetical protein